MSSGGRNVSSKLETEEKDEGISATAMAVGAAGGTGGMGHSQVARQLRSSTGAKNKDDESTWERWIHDSKIIF
ncbi:hypothetical protein ACS0TY_008197 [Phlomoides rotata]